MFRARIKVWIIILVVCLIGNGVWKWIGEVRSRDVDEGEYNIVINDDMMHDDVVDRKIKLVSNGSKSVQGGSVEEADVVVCMSGEEMNLEGFSKSEKKIYSPIVVYMRYSAASHEGALVVNEVGVDGECYKIDLIRLIEAVEKDLRWKDLGYNGDYMKGKVNVCIPNESCWYYEDVVECIGECIRNSGSNEDEVEDRVEKFLDGCIKVSDLGFTLANWNKITGTDGVDGNGMGLFNCVAIGPEFVGLKGCAVSGYGMSRDKYETGRVSVCRCGKMIEGEIWIRDEEVDESEMGEGMKDSGSEDVREWLEDLEKGRELIGEWSNGKGWSKVKKGSEVWRMWLECGWRVG